MKNGLYALASLDGRALSPRDLAVMGLDPAAAAAGGCAMMPRDVRAAAIHRRAHDGGIDVLLGHLDEPDDARRRIGRPATTDDLDLVLETVRRFGDDACTLLPGRWLLARWDRPAATMTLLMAERVRDTCHVATDGTRLALSPELARLARLDWVDATPDPLDLAISVGRAPLRGTLGDRTILRDVRRVLPGSRVVVRRHEIHVTAARPAALPAVARALSFDEAVEQVDALLRRIVRQLIERDGDTALALSGGLDSTLLALYAAHERGDARLTFLTSAAPPGSGLKDESHVAAITAAHLGIPIERVAPGAAANVYRPSDRIFRQQETPLLSLRHYLDEALEQAALDHGAHALLNGTGGELTVTNHGHSLPRPRTARAVARAVRDRVTALGRVERWPDIGFHVRLSRAALGQLPRDLRDLWREARIVPRRLRDDDALGFETGALRAAERHSWGIVPALRSHAPFYDRRLLRHAAALPAALVRHADEPRALARQLLRNRLPASIADARTKLAYSPNYPAMIGAQAAATRARIARFRAADLDEWIDLDWLDVTLAIAARSPPSSRRVQMTLQQTAVFAEYLLWWRRSTT